MIPIVINFSQGNYFLSNLGIDDQEGKELPVG